MKVIPKALLKKHAKVKRMPKSNKRMKRHFDDGGDVEASLPDFDPSQIDNPAPTLGPVNYDNLSFGKAFALARKMGDKTFNRAKLSLRLLLRLIERLHTKALLRLWTSLK